MINQDTTGSYLVTPTIDIDVRYHLPWKPVILNKEMDWDIILEYSPSFSYENSSPLFAGTIQNQFSLIWKLNLNLITIYYAIRHRRDVAEYFYGVDVVIQKNTGSSMLCIEVFGWFGAAGTSSYT